jgi:hypothetical protein
VSVLQSWTITDLPVGYRAENVPLIFVAASDTMSISYTSLTGDGPMQIEFTSKIDRAGYKIAPAKRPRRGQSILDTFPDEWDEARIVGLGGGQRKLRLSEYPYLFTKFADVKTPQELLEFVTKYGPLNVRDHIPSLLHAAADMKEAVQSKAFPPWPLADLTATLSMEKGSVITKFSPVTLLDALWLQIGQAKFGGSQFKECEYCGKLFQVGEGGRRVVARFCSKEHSTKWFSLERPRKKGKR